MSALSVPNTFVAATTILSAAVNANFAAIVAWADGEVGEDNLDILTGTVEWNITTAVNALTITSSSTGGIISVTGTGVLASGNTALGITSSVAQTAGTALARLNLSHASSTIPVLRVDNSGTGLCLDVRSTTGASLPSPVMTATQLAAIPTPAAGWQAFNSTRSAPAVHDGTSWRTPLLPNSSAAKTTTYTATNLDHFLRCDATSAGFTVTIPAAAAAYKDQYLHIKKTDSTFNVVTLATGISTTLNTQNEEVTIFCDGSAWIEVRRYIPSVWTSYSPTGNNSTNVTRTGFWRRVGDTIQIRGHIAIDNTGGSGTYGFALPSGPVFDTAKLTTTTAMPMGYAILRDSSTTNRYSANVQYNDNSSVLFQALTLAAGSTHETVSVTELFPYAAAAGDSIALWFEGPISGWKS